MSNGLVCENGRGSGNGLVSENGRGSGNGLVSENGRGSGNGLLQGHLGACPSTECDKMGRIYQRRK